MDLKIEEHGNGGELVKTSKDLTVIEGFENMVYLAMFGGNVEQSTPVNRPENVQMFDWWANDLFFKNNPSLQFNSITERTLNEVALNSAGRILIEEAVLSDLEFMTEFAEVSAQVNIKDHDRVEIKVFIGEPNNIQGKKFEYIWDATRQSLIDQSEGEPI